ncbi:MAG: hypothetical protein IJZ75_00990 [Clostridia bacterium]|nr:hypothetical protein [Clostridia bacterium]
MYRIAEFNMDFKDMGGYLKKLCAPFECESGIADIEITVTPKDLEREKELAENPHSREYLESVAANRLLAEILPQKDAFLLHSAVFEVGGEGVAFAARSGTGKTTHLLRWQALLGDKLTVINGDKPFVRFFEGSEYPFAYGTPWKGKENLGNTGKTPLKHICFIERGGENKAEELKKDEAADLLFSQVYMPKNPQSAAKTLELLEKLLNTCKLWKITCNLDNDAAKNPYKTIFER